MEEAGHEGKVREGLRVLHFERTQNATEMLDPQAISGANGGKMEEEGGRGHGVTSWKC